LCKNSDDVGATALGVAGVGPSVLRAAAIVAAREGPGAKIAMDARAFDKSKLPSRHVTEGPSRAPHRSYYYAMGLTEDEIHKPFVGVLSCWNEAAPCNIESDALRKYADSVGPACKGAVTHAGGSAEVVCYADI
jgi:hypothetical protein